MKTIIITGASSGIGWALATHFAKIGHQIIAVGRNADQLKKLKNLFPENMRIVIADLKNVQDRIKIKNILSVQAQGVYLIHNAGIAVPSTLTNMTEKIWDNHYLTNIKAPVFLTQLLLPNLKNGGRILSVSTGLAHHPLPGFSAYGTTKAAFYMLKEFFNAEFKNEDIAWGSAMPGIVDTPLQEHLRAYDSQDFPAVNLFRGFQERNELLSPLSVAKFLAWLLLESPLEQFKNNDWNIYDEFHHPHWVKDSNEIKEREYHS